MSRAAGVPRVDWLDPLRALALLGILLNHLVEEFGPGPWFTNPSTDWPNFSVRMAHVFPHEHPWPISIIQFLGWLGDSGPGVFLVVSGFGLTWSALHRNHTAIRAGSFLQRRVLRLFPAYVLLHICFLGMAAFVPSSSWSFADPKTLLSLLGLRFLDDVFFYINPSWWFVWLILQLYIIYHYLFSMLRRLGVGRFLLIAVSFTFLSRLCGLLGLRYSGDLYYWMTGIFFGTRLAEFCVGMALAAILKEIRARNEETPQTISLFAVSLCAYVSGLLASFTWYGTIVSNLLVTVGLTGLFFSLWKGIFSRNRFTAMALTMLGIESYGIYLVHQTPLQVTGRFLGGSLHLIAAVSIVILSFPAGALLNRVSARVPEKIRELSDGPDRRYLIALGWLLGLAVLAALSLIEPEVAGRDQRILAAFVGTCSIAIMVIEIACFDRFKPLASVFRWAVLASSLLYLIVFPPDFGRMAVLIGSLIGASSALAFVGIRKLGLAWLVGITVVTALLICAEAVLSHSWPVESGSWGEFAALQLHPTRRYSLKPSQETHLKYNNYDYVLRTNSLGLNSPEIEHQAPSENTVRILVIGDAFTMPEGVAYAHSYPALLERELSKMVDTTKVGVVNAGVTGYGPAEQHPQLVELNRILKPDVVLYAFFVNEFDEVSLDPQQRLSSIGFLNETKYPLQARLQRSQIKAHLGLLFRQLQETLTNKPSRWRYDKSLLAFYERGDAEMYSPDSLDKLSQHLRAMNEACQDIHASFIIYYVPGAVEVSAPSDIEYLPRDIDLSDTETFDLNRPFSTLQNMADELGIVTVNLRETLKANPRQPVYFPDSWHWNREGHQAVARFIAKDMAARGLLTEQ